MNNQVANDTLNKETLKYSRPELVNSLKDRYHGVADHINTLVEDLNKLNGETRIFTEDLISAKAALKAFNKISLGKYL